MELTEEQIQLGSGLIAFGIEKEAVPYLIAGLREPQLTEAMIDYLVDNPTATREDILLKVVELRKRR